MRSRENAKFNNDEISTYSIPIHAVYTIQASFKQAFIYFEYMMLDI